jgi:hypothetical protein
MLHDLLVPEGSGLLKEWPEHEVLRLDGIHGGACAVLDCMSPINEDHADRAENVSSAVIDINYKINISSWIRLKLLESDAYIIDKFV